MTIITTKTNVLNYINNVMIVPNYYENNRHLYIGLYNTETGELYTDLTTNIDIPVLPCDIYIETGTEKERFAKEQKHIFFDMGKTVKQGNNTYKLYQYNGYIH
jgi:hypothetical protein